MNCKKFKLFVMISSNTKENIFPIIKFNFYLILSENSCRLGWGSWQRTCSTIFSTSVTSIQFLRLPRGDLIQKL